MYIASYYKTANNHTQYKVWSDFCINLLADARTSAGNRYNSYVDSSEFACRVWGHLNFSSLESLKCSVPI